MIRVNASLSKKVPGAEQYSSRQYGASMEVEVGDGVDTERIKERIRNLYAMLNAAVDEQIRQAQGGNGKQTAPRQSCNGRTAPKGNGSTCKNGRNARRVPATEAQCKAIYAICQDRGIQMSEVLASFGVERAEELTVKEASGAIDALKRQ